jgi:hypothetical protein
MAPNPSRANSAALANNNRAEGNNDRNEVYIKFPLQRVIPAQFPDAIVSYRQIAIKFNFYPLKTFVAAAVLHSGLCKGLILNGSFFGMAQ